MQIRLRSSAVVITAQQLNPSIFTLFWVSRHLNVAEEEFLPGTVYAPHVSNCLTKHFSLLVLPDRLQFAPNVGEEGEGPLIMDKVGAIVRALPHTPYTAAGINFEWGIDSQGQPNTVVSRKLFFSGKGSLATEFDKADACFGAYYSMNTLGCRLRLDMKPASDKSKDQNTDFILCSFNYHSDLTGVAEGARVGRIESLLVCWNDAKTQSRGIVDAVAKEAD